MTSYYEQLNRLLTKSHNFLDVDIFEKVCGFFKNQYD